MTKISISFVVALVAIGLLVAVGAALIVWSAKSLRWNGWHKRNEDGYHNASSDFLIDGGMPLVLGIATVVLTLGFGAWGLYPYDMEYHRFTHVTGTIQEVQGRLLAEGHGTSQYYALKLPQGTYRCDDTRCSLLKPGDNVSLWCIREWEYASTSGWGCRFESGGPS